MKLEIFTDGGCSGNPGPAAIGVVIKENGRTIKTVARSIGEGTNNIAEYAALIEGLKQAQELNADEVHINSDSELMCRQISGHYAVKHGNIKPLFGQAKQLIAGFKKFNMSHVLREKNSEADALVRSVLKKQSKDGRSDANGVGEESPSSKG